MLNGSPRRNGTVASLLKAVTEPLAEHDIEWVDVYKLNMKFCTACMASLRKDSRDYQFGKHQVSDLIVASTNNPNIVKLEAKGSERDKMQVVFGGGAIVRIVGEYFLA